MTTKEIPQIYEILEKVSRARKEETKVSSLRKYDSSALRTVLLLNYHPNINFVEFSPVNYNANENPPSSLYEEYVKLGHLTQGGGRMKGTEEEVRQAYVRLLSSIHKEDAELIALCKEKRLEEKYNITFDIVKKAFPELIWE